MLGHGIFDFTRKGPMSLKDASELIGVFNRITQRHSKVVNGLITRLESVDAQDRTKTAEIETAVNREIEEWNNKIRKLGAIPKGLWLVDIDAGDGYYCWKFPEVKIEYWHDYNSGFSGRIPLAERPHANRPSTNKSSLR
jgi:hypothetical protein